MYPNILIIIQISFFKIGKKNDFRILIFGVYLK